MMKKSKLKIKKHGILFCILFCILYFAFLISAISAQSTNQSFPTAVTSNDISGRILARDIGDARLTDYFYAFNANQGDVFINVQTANFNGDIDVFTAGNLKPLVKITVYADDTNRETGRVVYLRQPAKLVLRVEGRSPNDDSATFNIKFAGSFVPLQTVAENVEPEAPEVKSETKSDIRVNSIGTIIEVKPKPQPAQKEIIAKKESNPRRKKSEILAKNKAETKEAKIKDTDEKVAENKETRKEDVKEKTEENAEENNAAKSKIENEDKSAPSVVIIDNSVPENTVKEDALKTKIEDSTAVNEENSTEKPAAQTAAPKSAAKNRAGKSNRAINTVKKVAKPAEPNPLENIHLIILLKDGTRIEQTMSEVLRVGVVKSVLTVVSNDGSTKRYPILDVAKMTIE